MPMSKDALKIMALPHAHHPLLADIVRELAATPSMTLQKASSVLDIATKHCRIHALDLEMCQPGQSVRVPFAVPPPPDGRSTFQAAIEGHVQRILNGGRR